MNLIPRLASVDIGKSVSLNCTHSGTVKWIAWYKNGVLISKIRHPNLAQQPHSTGSTALFPPSLVNPLAAGAAFRATSGSDRIRMLSAEVLHISSANRADKGTYQCEVSNERETILSSAQLILRGKLKLRFSSVKQFFSLSVSQSFNLSILQPFNPLIYSSFQIINSFFL